MCKALHTREVNNSISIARVHEIFPLITIFSIITIIILLLLFRTIGPFCSQNKIFTVTTFTFDTEIGGRFFTLKWPFLWILWSFAACCEVCVCRLWVMSYRQFIYKQCSVFLDGVMGIKTGGETCKMSAPFQKKWRCSP